MVTPERNASIRHFEAQFRRQVREGEFTLNTFDREQLAQQFEDWRILGSRSDEFPAAGGTLKVFSTLIALRPER